MDNCNPVSNPLATYFKLSANSCPKSKEEMERMSHIPYSSAVGSLMYAMVYTRPDLTYAVSMLSCYMHNPDKHHREAVKWIIHCVKGSLGRCLVFDKSKTAAYNVAGFVDSDYGGDLDHRRSISSYISPCVRVQSHGRHHYSLLQLYPLLRLNISL